MLVGLSIGFALVALILPLTLGQVVPALDPFYTPPPGAASQPPGTVLRTRKIQASFFGLVPDPVESWQLLYRTNAADGSAIADVTTVFKPTNATLDRFVSFHTAYDGAARSGICDPSYNYQLGAVQFDLISSVEYFILQGYLLQGYVVSSPDYEGPDSAFGAGRLAGTGVLDSMRAVIDYGDTLGFTTKRPQVVAYGYSGGAIATGWAAGLQPKYAPELNMKGWAQGGTPANLTGTAVYIDGTTFAGFLPQVAVGLSAPSSYGAQLNPIFSAILTAAGRAALATAKMICGAENLFAFASQRIQSTKYQTLGDRLFYQPTVRDVLNQQLMGRNKDETPTTPVLMYHAADDEIIPYDNATTLRATWCANGASVKFVTYGNGGHLSTEILGVPGAYEFVNNAFAGTVGGPCTQQTVLDNSLNPVALGAQLEPVFVGLLNALAKAGQGDSNIKQNLGVLNETVSS